MTTRWVWLDALKRAGVETRTGLSYRRITAGRGRDRDSRTGRVETIAADRVVIAAGQERRDELRPLLERLEVPHRVVGGAENPSELNAVRAFGDGLRAAYELAGERLGAASAEIDPGRGRGEDAVVGLELLQRGADLGGDPRPDLLGAVAPEAQHLARRADRHRQVDRVVEVSPIRIGRSLRRSSIASKPAICSCSLTVSALAIENGPGPQVGSSVSSGWSR